MAELAALNVKISGDSGGLVAAVNSAQGSLTSFGRVTTAAEANARGFDRALRNTGGAATDLQRQINSLTGVMNTNRRSAEVSAQRIEQLASAAERAGDELVTASNRAKGYGTQATSAAMHTGNLAAQFNDIGVMLAAGQSPLMLALQQGTQINQVFGQMGTGASRLRMLGSALVSIISPANLVTIGLIAGGAALVQFGMNALASRDQAANLADTLSTLNDIQTTLNGANEILAMTTEELTQKYGEYADEVRRAAESIAILAEAQAIQATRDALADLGREFGRLTSSGSAFDTAMTTALERIQAQFRVGYREAQALNRAFVALETATTWEQQVEALRNIETVMAQTGANAADLPPELLKALQQLNQMVIASGALSEGFKEASENAAMMLPTLYFDSEAPPSGGGGGGVSLADRIEQDLERLREGFMSEAELQAAAYAEQQELLQSALERRLITQQEYNALMEQAQQQHQDAMASIDAYRYGDALDKTGAFLGDMATIMANGNDKMLRISKVFGAAQALISTYQGAAKELEKGVFGFATAAALISKGLAFVSAIKGVSSGGGGGGGGGAAVAGAAPAAAAAPSVSRNVAISLTGGDMFSRSQVVRLINSINEAVEDGAIVRVV